MNNLDCDSCLMLDYVRVINFCIIIIIIINIWDSSYHVWGHECATVTVWNLRDVWMRTSREGKIGNVIWTNYGNFEDKPFYFFQFQQTVLVLLC